jgi:hypothetical protein
VSLYKNKFSDSASPDYPNAVPVVLDVVRGDGTGPLIKVNSRIDYGQIPLTHPLAKPFRRRM